jgi:DNA-binding NarL/FixJ family response regulator
MTGSRRRSRLRVAVASDQSLVSDAVRTALAERGFEPVVLRWPGEVLPRPRQPVRRGPVDVGLLVSELDRRARIRAAGLVMRRGSAPWAVLTGAPRGPLWGAALEGGAGVVLSSETSLEDVIATLQRLAHGQTTMPEADQRVLRAAWDEQRHRDQVLRERAGSLTPREREVLLLLYSGEPVGRIAALFDVSPATVRSQVKSVLRKLEVNSQLAAVAAVRALLDDAADEVRS